MSRTDDRPSRASNTGDHPEARTEMPLAEVISTIRRLRVRSPRDSAIAVGEYLLVELFGGLDVPDKSHTGWAVFRDISHHPDLPVTAKLARDAMLVAATAAKLPPELRHRLTLGQLRVLHRVQEPALREALAVEAVEVGWSAVELSHRAREHLPEHQRERGRGRPPKPTVTKIIEDVHHSLDALAGLADTGTPISDRALTSIAKKLRAIKPPANPPQRSSR